MLTINISVGFDERDVPERGAPGDGERRRGPALSGALLQPQERPPAGAHAGARLAGASAAVQAHDLRRVPHLHTTQGAARKEPGRVTQGRRPWLMMIHCMVPLLY
jgi:hypothetical protein